MTSPAGFPKECGKQIIKQKNEPAIANGSLAYKGQFPWMAFLGQYEQTKDGGHVNYYCGGSLITERIVLSSAGCINPKQADYKNKLDGVVKFGSLLRVGDYDHLYSIETSVAHEEFKSTSSISNINNVALVILQEKAKLTDYIQPICLPFGKPKYPVGTEVLLSGIGSTLLVNAPALSEQLKFYTGVIITKDPNNNPAAVNFTEQHFVVSGYNQTISCTGDRGGPLVTYDKVEDKFYQIGVSSYQYGSSLSDKERYCLPTNVAGFAKVEVFLPWIEGKASKYV